MYNIADRMGGSATDFVVVSGASGLLTLPYDSPPMDVEFLLEMQDLPNIADLEKVVKAHLPGQHDQQRHAGGGGAGGKQFSEMGASRAERNMDAEGAAHNYVTAGMDAQYIGMNEPVSIERKVAVIDDLSERIGDKHDSAIMGRTYVYDERRDGDISLGNAVEYQKAKGSREAYLLVNNGTTSVLTLNRGEKVSGVDGYGNMIELIPLTDAAAVTIAARKSAINSVVSGWAKSSNDNDPNSLALQDMAQAEFGLDADGWANDIQVGTDAVIEKNGSFYRDVLRAQYNATQESFATAGITEVTLHRGVTDASDTIASMGEAG